MSILPQRLCRIRFPNPYTFKHYGSTIDTKEIDHHNQFADKWWDKSWGPMKALHAMNDLRIPFIRNGLINAQKLKAEDCNKPKYFQGIKMLDVGCGGGILTLPLARLGADITGLDASNDLIEVAKCQAQKTLPSNTKVQFVCNSIEDYSVLNRESFDVLIVSEVLEHVSLKEMFLHSCIDALKPGGSIFITTINRTNLAWLSAIVLAEYVLNIVPQGNHEWSKLVTPEEVEVYLKNAGCKIVQINGMMYIPYRNTWCWVPQTTVNYAVHAVKLI
ncbi:hypothetical protein O3M35_003425 [Rhynocoris fuscipes]|uniref:Ubiquinone biosynthesis O-methyltransferase, mitochondrial n=1 Tax=Rhynocoris fuscipes TaxID=488301 RepID=A0AAW1CRJ0_9HEMI